MDEAVALGRIKAPGYFADPLAGTASLGAEWIGPAPGQIDPNKEIDAAEKRVSLGVSTVEKETAELTGGDFERNIPQIKKERRLLKEAGLLTAEAKPPAPGAPKGNGNAMPMNPEDTPQNEDQPEG